MSEEEIQEIIYNDLGFCGCGNPEVVLQFVHQALRLIKQRKESGWNDDSNTAIETHFRSEKDELFYWMAWYFLDRSKLIEHGTGVGGSWLTEKGEDFLQYLDTHSISEILKA